MWIKAISINDYQSWYEQAAGMKQGDFIVAIGEEDVKWAMHDQVVLKIKEAKKSGSSLCLKLVTPMDRNYLKVSAIY